MGALDGVMGGAHGGMYYQLTQPWEEATGEVEPVAVKVELTVAAARDLPALDSNVRIAC